MRARAQILLFLLFFSGNDWELRKNEDNIRVYTRRITTSDFKELQCKTTVKATLGSIIKLLADDNNFPQWIYGCIKSSHIKNNGTTESYAYQLFDVPWPFDDRDVVAVGRISQDSKTKIVTIKSESVDGLLPENEGIIRIKNFHSSYILIPKPNGVVDINFEMGSEPGGVVPAWLVNMVIIKGPFLTHKKLTELLQTPVYKNVKLDFIEEL